jgi:hypothetical protein
MDGPSLITLSNSSIKILDSSFIDNEATDLTHGLRVLPAQSPNFEDH